MKRFSPVYRCSLGISALSLMALATLSACGGDDEEGGITPEPQAEFEDFAMAQAIINDFADAVVVPTYEDLATRLEALDTAVQTLAAERSQANLDAARTAWIEARVPWEASEGFLFGPVDSRGLDPALDSWPTDQNALDGVLATSDALTKEYVANLDTTLQGFHTAEYLIFGVGGTKVAEDLTDREIEYLTAVSSLLADTANALADSWTEGSQPYASVFKAAGTNSVYPSLSSAAEEIVRGMIGIADEVANGKVADPFDQRDASLVESQYALNSLTDFKNNLRSIQHAYTGDVAFTGTEGTGLDAYVASVDADIDARFRAEIEAGIDALSAIPEPFSASILDPEAMDEIRAAQEAIRTIQMTLEQDILPLVL